MEHEYTAAEVLLGHPKYSAIRKLISTNRIVATLKDGDHVFYCIAITRNAIPDEGWLPYVKFGPEYRQTQNGTYAQTYRTQYVHIWNGIDAQTLIDEIAYWRDRIKFTVPRMYLKGTKFKPKFNKTQISTIKATALGKKKPIQHRDFSNLFRSIGF